MNSDPIGELSLAQLQQASLGMVPGLPPFKALKEINNRVKNAQFASNIQGQQAIQKAQGMQGQPTITENLLRQAKGLDSGVAKLPYGPQKALMAGGGLVSFVGGGLTLGYDPLVAEAEQFGVPLPLSGEARILALQEIARRGGKEAARRLEGSGAPDTAAQMRKDIADFTTSKPLLERWFGRAAGDVQDPVRVPDYALPPIPTSIDGKSIYPNAPTLEPVPIPEIPGFSKQKQVSPGGIGGPAKTGPGIASLVPNRPNLPEAELPLISPPLPYDTEGVKAAEKAAREAAGTEYDKRFGYASDYAKELKEGKYTRQPNTITAALATMRRNYNDQRVAGFRPTLGTGLAAAAEGVEGARSKYADERKRDTVMAMQMQMSLDQAKLAYENGERDRANTLFNKAWDQGNKILESNNEQKKLKYADAVKRREEERLIWKEQLDAEMKRLEMASRERIAHTMATARSSADNMLDVERALAGNKDYQELVKREAQLNSAGGMNNPSVAPELAQIQLKKNKIRQELYAGMHITPPEGTSQTPGIPAGASVVRLPGINYGP